MKARQFLLTILILGITFPSLVYADTQTQILQPSTMDVILDSNQPDLNHNLMVKIYVQSDPPQRSVLKFDLSVLPDYIRIEKATLSLRKSARDPSPPPEGRTIWVYRVTSSWVENEATWNNRDLSTPWTSSGGDYTLVDGASSTVPVGWVFMNWDVTAIVGSWVNGGSPNYGFILIDSEEGQAETYVGFESREASTESLRPILKIEYTELEPVGGVLMPNIVSSIASVVLVGTGTIALLLGRKKIRVNY